MYHLVGLVGVSSQSCRLTASSGRGSSTRQPPCAELLLIYTIRPQARRPYASILFTYIQSVTRHPGLKEKQVVSASDWAHTVYVDSRLRVEKITRPDFFGWGQGRVYALAACIQILCQGVDLGSESKAQALCSSLCYRVEPA